MGCHIHRFSGCPNYYQAGFGHYALGGSLPLATAVFYALYQILTRVAGRTEDTKTSLFWTSTVGVITMSCIVPRLCKSAECTGLGDNDSNRRIIWFWPLSADLHSR